MILDAREVEIHLIDFNGVPYVMVQQVTSGSNTLINAYIDAVEGVTLNTFRAGLEVNKDFRQQGSTNWPTNDQALNQIAWLVSVSSEATGEPLQYYIPGADTSLLLPNSDNADLTTPEMVALVNSIENIIGDGNEEPVTVTAIRLVGLSSP